MDRFASLKKDIVSQEKLREDLLREICRLQMERDILEAASVVIKKARALIWKNYLIEKKLK